jgi:hypothetical protein
MKAKRYKKLMRVLLQYIFTDEDNADIIEQVLLRIAYHDGYVELDDDKDFVLSDKGVRLIEVER